jgi:TRAP-type C4-dicarboxylate transport system substrate-binding protein
VTATLSPWRPTRRDAALLLGLLGGGAAVTLGLSRLGTPADARWDLSIPWGLSEFHTTNAMRLARGIAQVTQGRVRIATHPGASLGIKGQDGLRAVADGVVAMTDLAGFQQVGLEPILGLEALPFLIDDERELALLYRELRPLVEAAFARRGLVVLTIVPWPRQYFYFKQPVARVADWRGLKMRSQDRITSALVDGLGMVAVQMPSADVVPALASGAIDAVMTSTTTAAAQKYWEFLRYILPTNHIWASNFLVVNAAAWARVSAADRAAITALARALEPQFWAVAQADDADKRAVLLREGMVELSLPPALKAAMVAIAKPLWRQFLSEVPEAVAVLQAYLAATNRTL